MLFKPFGFYKPIVAVTAGDPDANAFISAAGITDPTQQSAIQTLVTDLKSASIWTEMIAIYPFVGGTASSHKYNLKDPRDLDAAYRLDIPAGYTNDSNGITANDTDLADTHFLPSSYWSDNLSAAMGFYSLDWPSNQQNISMGADSTGTGFNMINEPYQAPGNKYMGRAFIQLINPSTQLSTNIGLTTISRTNNTNLQFYFNDESVASNTTAEGSTSRPTNNVAIGGLAGGSQRSDQNYAFAFISEGLDGTQMSNLYSAVQSYQTTLSRQVPDIQRTNLFRWFDAEWYADSSTWTDLAGRQSATVQSVTYTSGTPDYYDFPGGAGTIGIGSAASSDLSLSNMTIQMWVKHDTTNNTQFCVASQRSTTGTGGTRYSLHLNPSANTAGIYNGAGFTTVSGATQTSGTWYFFEFVMTTSQVTVYQNNSLVGTIARGINTAAGDEPFGIGTPNFNLSTFSSEYFNGQIAMCMVYDTSTRPTGNWDATKARFGY
jgi:hypothetical protein